MTRLSILVFSIIVLLLQGCTTNNKPYSELNGSYYFVSNTGNQLKVTPYGGSMIRLQTIAQGESFYANSHYEMVETHDWSTRVKVSEDKHKVTFATTNLRLVVDSKTLMSEFYVNGIKQSVLSEKTPVSRQNNLITTSFNADPTEHYTGLGHGYYARSQGIDLKGQIVNRNYGSQPIEQAPLIVPFYISNKGYGIFLNSTFSNTFRFSADGEYSFSIDDSGFNGQMDYFFIAGNKIADVLDNYTQLTGRPRLPQKSMFGLQLSDKSHDHNSDTPSNMTWWQKKVTEHRAAGYPLDHIVNDNRWRASGGKRCESKIAWDPTRYPDPEKYQAWLDEHGLVITLDFNRCIAQYSEGWQSSFNIPNITNIEFPDSAPDLTNAEFRDWFWQVFDKNALKPKENYPGDALWIDEFDEQGAAPKELILSNGASSAEMRNYWFFLIAKALVEQGWDKSGINKRPFVWVRGMTAGAQRYATLWSGDIYPNYSDMKSQIRGMQLAGLSGFPYWGHDAGGFYDWNAGVGPDENLYQRWGMAFGSFAPIWKPHGMGQSRWPLDRSAKSQQTARNFTQLRYSLMPYLYSAAHQAAATGLPIARAMIFDHQHHDEAWQYDLQYMWGDSLLVAPQTQDAGEMKVWLPSGKWYQYDTKQAVSGNQIRQINPEIHQLPLYVKAGAIIPSRPAALSTAFIDKSKLNLTIYSGADGQYKLIEDDDKTEAYRTKNEKQTTLMSWQEEQGVFVINPALGHYNNAPTRRDIEIEIVGLTSMSDSTQVKVNGINTPFIPTRTGITISVANANIDKKLTINVF